jgi:antitoxin (DNA-binding transcriptional repressor) of toxin-antitoxin stability system
MVWRSWFGGHGLAVMDEVQAKREAGLITKHGKPVAKRVPPENDTDKDDILGFMAGKGKMIGDSISPAIRPEEWGHLY